MKITLRSSLIALALAPTLAFANVELTALQPEKSTPKRFKKLRLV